MTGMLGVVSILLMIGYMYLKKEATERGKSKNLSNYLGPYRVKSINSPTNITLQIKRKGVKVHLNRVKPMSAVPGI